MKTFIPAFLMLFIANNIIAQYNFIEGYITTESNETILVELYIPPSGKLQAREKNGNTTKYKRKKLKDYGYFVNGQKTSQFAATAFALKTYDGYYISNRTGDKVEGYFIKWSSDLIVMYKKSNRKKLKVTPSETKGFAVKKGKNYIVYDKIDYDVRVGLLDTKMNRVQFCKPRIEGKITFYETMFSIDYPGYMGANGTMTGGSSQAFPVYVFVKEDKTYALEYRKVRSKDKVLRDLKEVFSDYPELYNSIDKTTFKKEDIPNLVSRYNDYFANQSK